MPEDAGWAEEGHMESMALPLLADRAGITFFPRPDVRTLFYAAGALMAHDRDTVVTRNHRPRRVSVAGRWHRRLPNRVVIRVMSESEWIYPQTVGSRWWDRKGPPAWTGRLTALHP